MSPGPGPGVAEDEDLERHNSETRILSEKCEELWRG